MTNEQIAVPTETRLAPVRYVLVGGSMAVLFAALVWLFHAAGLYGWMSSLLSSFCVSVPTFILHRRFTFGASGPLLTQIAGFTATALSNVPVGAGVVFLLVDILGVHPFISGLAATVGAAVLNYTLLSRVFKQQAAPA